MASKVQASPRPILMYCCKRAKVQRIERQANVKENALERLTIKNTK